jgi:hypothetical protein
MHFAPFPVMYCDGQEKQERKLSLNRIPVMGYPCGGLQAIENSADRRVKSVMLFASGTFERDTS